MPTKTNTTNGRTDNAAFCASDNGYRCTVISQYNNFERITSNGDSLSGSAAKRDDYVSRRSIADSVSSTAKKPPISGGGAGGSNSSSNHTETNGHGGGKLSSSSSSGSRLSSSSSSPSLARLVATSGLDMYEKYSPANYKPNCELSRSRSGHAEQELENGSGGGSATPTETVTLDRPRSSRYSRLYSNSSDAGGEVTTSSGRLGTGTGTGTTSRSSSGSRYSINNSNSSGDVPTATFTLRSSRTRRSQAEDRGETNGGGLEAKLNGLSLLSTSPKRNAIYESRSGSNLRNQDTTDDAGISAPAAAMAMAMTMAAMPRRRWTMEM
ncbi:putative protein TPRXL [Drosophila serrata]|uniref:putative protein TPRXL n=1 Tax=Drosophila serrata TaxID=7274 RepID=UPI000A1D1B30|nr:putative protein TPRXL [Drosophila serrata]